MQIAVLAKASSDRAADAAVTVHAWLSQRGHSVVVDEDVAALRGLPGGLPRARLADGSELAIALGGDGTLLLAARLFCRGGVPILGVNLGRLGFLTDTDHENMLEVLDRVLAGDRQIEARMMLTAEIHRGGEVLGPLDAFNDVVVNKGALARVVHLETRVNDHFVSRYRADGLIVSTPTGTTAYGLAAGGPIVEPTTEVMMVAPICPHILTNRPLIIAGDSAIDCILVETAGKVYLTIDGQEGLEVLPGDRIRVRRSPHRARLVHSASRDFFDILRTKMGWG